MFEPVTSAMHKSSIGLRQVHSRLPAINTALKLTDLLPRLVYDCNFQQTEDPNP